MSNKRGRKTAGSLEAVKAIPARPEPPDDLDEKQADVWREVTSGLPVDWFGDETLRLLKAYCIHMARFERLSARIDQELEDMDPTDLSKLGKQAEVESRAAMSLATKMRVTQQATYDRERKKDPTKPKVAWRTKE